MAECKNCGDCTHGDEQTYCSTACQMSDQYRQDHGSVGGLSNGCAGDTIAHDDAYFDDLKASDEPEPPPPAGDSAAEASAKFWADTHNEAVSLGWVPDCPDSHNHPWFSGYAGPAKPEHRDCTPPPPTPGPPECGGDSGSWFPEGTKPTNPKDAIGADKIPLHLWPETATVLGSLALLDGALKYGRSNFRAIGVKASIYVDAAKRHLNAWFEGQDTDPDSGLPHLAHLLACAAILVDAEATGKLNDDRMYPGGYLAAVTLYTHHVARLKAKHADRSPKHYTIASEEVDAQDDDDNGGAW